MDRSDHTADSASDSEATCSLCSFPVPARPVTGPTVEGTFCCRGCLEVARTLETVSASPSPPRADGGRGSDGEREESIPVSATRRRPRRIRRIAVVACVILLLVVLVVAIL